MAKVGIVMGSDSDMPVMAKAADILEELGISYEMKKYEEKGRKGKSIRVLVLGIPNVGKSSFINKIAKKNAMEVGNRPGVTKQKQWVRISNNIELPLSLFLYSS